MGANRGVGPSSRSHGSSAICSRLSRSLRRRACSRPHTPRCPPAGVISRLVCTQPATSAALGFRAHVHWSAARLRARCTPRVYRTGPSAPTTDGERDASGNLEKSTTNSPTTDELGSSCPALLPRSRARRIARAGHMRDSTCHSADPFVVCVGWGVGDSKGDGGGKRSCCRFRPITAVAISLRGGLQPRCRTTHGADKPTFNTARSWPAPLRDG